MCGIAGIATRDSAASGDIVGRMIAEIRHRGPDDWGVEEAAPRRVTLGNARLAVIDLSTAGHQPMWAPDRSACLAYNGEIYNFRELRAELEALGHRFVSHSDTEVILAGYRAWGAGVVSRLNGMFALALWDAPANRLFVARDRLGKKPFYYWHTPSQFVFASEIKAILRVPGVPRQVDADALQSYLAVGYTPAPRTMFAGIHKLPAGHYAYLSPDRGELAIARYWRPPVPRPGEAPASLRRDIRREVEAAVERRLISDVPLGAFLSGGLDSSIVVGVMARLTDRPVRTFSTAFEVGARSFKYNVDAEAARRVSRHFGTDHTEIRISESQILGSVRDVVTALDEPITTPMFQTILLAREVRRAGVTVVLSGDGSDEIFGGYSRYLRNRVVETLARVPGPLLRAAGRAAGQTRRGAGFARAAEKARHGGLSPERYMAWWEYLDRDERAAITAPHVAARVDAPSEHLAALIAESGVATSTDLIAYLDTLLWIAEDSNMRMDKLCMSASLESRAPFLDYKVAEVGLSIPFTEKATWRTGKQLLRDAFADMMPAEVLSRAKWGWNGPIYHWMRGRLGAAAHDAIDALPRTGCFTGAVRDFDLRSPAPAPIIVWKLMLWAYWYDAYIEPLGLREAA